jgi:hypothetical protein
MSLKVEHGSKTSIEELENLVENLLNRESSVRTKSDLRAVLDEIIDYNEVELCDEYRLKTSVYAERALGEYPPNTVDSIIRHRMNDQSFSCCREAANELVEDDELDIVLDGDDEERTDVIVADSAYGQPREKFDRFTRLGDEDEHKRILEILHGCRGKGHLVSLENCEFKMVLSSTPESDSWTVTFIYKLNGDYVYVKQDAGFLGIDGELNCGEELGEKSRGTVFYHSDYEIPYKGNDISTFRKFTRRFSHGVVSPFVTINIVDRRREDARVKYQGLVELVRKNEELFDFIGWESTKGEIGELKTFVAIPKNKNELSTEEKNKLDRIVVTNEKSVILTVDGQSHYRTGSILGSRLGLNEIDKKSLVICELESDNASDLFDDDRRGFTDRYDEREFRDMLEECLGGIEELERLNTDRVVMPEDGFDSTKRRLDELDDDVDLTEHIDSESMNPVHRENLNRLSSMKDAAIVDKLIDEHGKENIFSNITEVIESGEVYVNRRSLRENKDESQAGRNAVGRIFELLAYVRLVELCESSGYVCYHEPELSEIPGLNPSDYSQKPDMDIVIVNDSVSESPVYVFSLKTSLKDRIKQSAFWMLRMKLPSVSSILGNSGNLFKGIKDMSMFQDKNRDVMYGYISPVWSGCASNSILDDFDFGFVPESETTDSFDSQFSITKLEERISKNQLIDKED